MTREQEELELIDIEIEQRRRMASRGRPSRFGLEPIAYNPGGEESIQPAPYPVDQSTGLPRYRPDVDPARADRFMRAAMPGAVYEGPLDPRISAYQGEPMPTTDVARQRISQTDAERNSSIIGRAGRTSMPYAPMDMQMAGMADATREDRVAATGMTDTSLRYGAPAAAGFLLGPAGPFLTSAVGATSQAIGSTLAELMQQEVTGKPMSGKEILSDTISAAAPFKMTGSLKARSAFNIGSNLLSSELAQKAAMGEDYRLKPTDAIDAFTRFALPIGLGGAMSLAGDMSSSVIEAAQGRKAFAEKYFGAQPNLIDVFPSLKNPDGSSTPNYRYAREAQELEYGNKAVQKLLDDKSIPIEQAIAMAFPNVDDTSEIAADLATKIGQLKTFRANQEQAVLAFNKAQELADSAKARQASDYPAQLAAAEEAGLEVTRKNLLFTDGASIMFGQGFPELGSVAAGVRDKAIAETGLAARRASDSAIDQLYLKANVGENTPVIYLPTVLRKIDEMTGPGKTFAGNEAAADVRKEFIDYFSRPSATYGGTTNNNTLTLEQFKRLQASIATKLNPAGVPNKAVDKILEGTYAVGREASADFFKNSRPEIAEAWATAQAAYAAQSQARGVGAIDLISKGESDKFFDLLTEKGGISKVFSEFNHYAEVIAATTDRANPMAIADAAMAAKTFKEGIYGVIRNTLVDRASNVARGSGFEEGLIGFDLGKLQKDLQTLKTKNFDISVLGLGTPEEIAALSRTQLASGNGGYSVAKLEEFFKELPLFGADVAANRSVYRDAVAAQLFTSGTANREAREIADKALGKSKLKADEMAEIYKKAAADPLVKLLDGTSMKLSGDVVDNIFYIDRLLEVGPKNAAGFTKAMQEAGRGADLATIKAAAPARVMRVFLPDGGENARFDIVKIREFFYGKSLEDVNKRETLKAIMNSDGGNSYEILVDRIVSPLNDILEAESILRKSSGSTTLRDFGNVARAQGRTGTGSGAGVTFRAGIPLFFEMYSKADYKVMNLLYLNERFAPKFSAAGYNVEKFVANSTVNAVALKLAQDEDAAAKAAPRQ